MSPVKTVLAAVGAAFIAIMLLSVTIAYLTGSALTGGDKVAVVRMDGVITDPTETVKQLKGLGKRKDVKAVVVRINSPGGAVGPSQEIYREIQKLKEKKPVVASMGAIAASGGFYAAVAADKIVALPGTITGSIGVIIEFMNAEELLSKIGLKGYVVKSGKFKDVGSPLRRMEPAERELMQSVIDDVNRQFIEAVAKGRNMDAGRVEKMADGRIFTGAQALANGLIDSLGGLSDAISLGAQMAGIEGEPEVIYVERRDLSLWNAVLGEGVSRITDIISGTRLMYMTTNP
ncbi:MAG: signal peptide peptidase SppA [Thermodesulfobacteriota bacterium]